jgi:hypothetical protein
MKSETLRKVKLSILALAGFMMFVGAPRVDAAEYHHHHHVLLYGHAYPESYNGPMLGHSAHFVGHGYYGPTGRYYH